MKLIQLILNVEIQSEYKIVYYDYDENRRIKTTLDGNEDKDIRYMYVEDGTLYIEIESEDE